MNNNYIVVTDSCSDLPMTLINEFELPVYPMEFTLEGKVYKNYPDEREIDLKEFYRLLKEGKSGSTSQISPKNFIDFFTPFLEKGQDIIYIAFSSALSGTYNSALVARETLLETYKDRKIIVIDSLTASTAEGKLTIIACENRRNGMSLEENAKDIEDKKMSVAVWFTVDDLQCLRRGGRLSSGAAFFGNLLSIKPVLHVSDEGKLIPMSKSRGRKASLIELYKRFIEDSANPDTDTIYLAHAVSDEEVELMKQKILKEFPNQKIVVSHIGPVIGMHSGPGTFLISFIGKKR